MTILKPQERTFEFVDVHLRKPVFNDFVFYLVFFRVKRQNNLEVLLSYGNERRTYNVVWKEALNTSHETSINQYWPFSVFWPEKKQPR